MRLENRNYLSLLVLLCIPITVSLSWVLGGELVKSISPMSLSIARLGFGCVVFFVFSTVLKELKNLTFGERMKWWAQQTLLAFTGRALYYVLTSSALVTISPLEALIVTTLMPILTILFERALGTKFKHFGIPSLGVIASAATACAILLRSGSDSNAANVIHVGHLLMLLGVVAYVAHLVLYARFVKNKNPASPLFAQFLLGFLMLIPFDLHGLGFLLDLSALKWAQFLFYALICNIVPFVAAHFALKSHGPMIVALVAITSPVFGTLFSLFAGFPAPSWWFFAMSAIAGILIAQCIKLNSSIQSQPQVKGEKNA